MRLILKVLRYFTFNSLRPSDAYLSNLTWSAWSAPSHSLNQRWNIIDSNFRNKLQLNLKRKPYIFIHEHLFAYVVWEIAAIWLQCVKYFSFFLCVLLFTLRFHTKFSLRFGGIYTSSSLLFMANSFISCDNERFYLHFSYFVAIDFIKSIVIAVFTHDLRCYLNRYYLKQPIASWIFFV